ncbi:hypothetical protein MHLNE_24380 [Moorella humiferrea]|uniref:copper amine oxidase N-terminal domain-containing protein n=1 Tax=Neomoorella humiferrea TaxID=676965 RepID=UPI0030CFCC2A
MSKKGLLAVFLTLALAVAAGGTAEASVGRKALTVDYNNVKLNVNGTLVNVQPEQEPFIVNGVTFVPLRLVAEALNSNVDWQADTSTVVINSKTSPEVINLKMQLIEKDKEIQSLQQQVAQLQQELAAKSSAGLDDLEGDLRDTYKKIGYVYLDNLNLSGDSDNVRVEVLVDLDDYGDEWANLSNSKIESWLDDVVRAIQDKFSEDTAVSGEIINSYNDDVLVKFNKDGDDDLEVDYRDEDYRDSSDPDAAINELTGKRYYVEDIRFTVSDASYSKSSNRATVYLKAKTSGASDAWDELSSSTIENEVQDICEDVVNVFDDAGINLEEVRAYFYDNDSSLIDSFTYNVDDETLD